MYADAVRLMKAASSVQHVAWCQACSIFKALHGPELPLHAPALNNEPLQQRQMCMPCALSARPPHLEPPCRVAVAVSFISIDTHLSALLRQQVWIHRHKPTGNAACRPLGQTGGSRTDNSLASHGSLEAAWGGQQATPLPTRHETLAEEAADLAAGLPWTQNARPLSE